VEPDAAVGDSGSSCADGSIRTERSMDGGYGVSRLFPVANGVAVGGGHHNEWSIARGGRLGEQREEEVASWRGIGRDADTYWEVGYLPGVVEQQKMHGSQINDDVVGICGEPDVGNWQPIGGSIWALG
jgi:hypothetical protein